MNTDRHLKRNSSYEGDREGKHGSRSTGPIYSLRGEAIEKRAGEDSSCLPFKFDLALKVLKQDEVLQEDMPPEVAVAELQIHELGKWQEKRWHISKTV